MVQIYVMIGAERCDCINRVGLSKCTISKYGCKATCGILICTHVITKKCMTIWVWL